MTQVTYSAADLAIERDWLSDAALQVAGGLQAAGFDGYLVGGCVRDLLLRRRPKDFDITTNASPEQIKRLFRRARIIGRRFQLVHVRIQREIIEVATYRAKPDGARVPHGRRAARPVAADGRVIDDNAFGTIEQDAARRDFTINSLYYDPRREQVLDFAGGVKDARKRILRMLGNPGARFTEDPVRMLRALRFRAKLDLTLERGLQPAIAECRELLESVPAARLFDEVLKTFHHGHARKGWEELREHGLAALLFPLTFDAGGGDALIEMALDNTDERVRRDKPVIAAFLFAVLLWRPFMRELARHHRLAHAEAVWAAADALFALQSRRVAVPRRVTSAVTEIWQMQFELEERKPRAIARLLGERRFRAAFDFLLLRARIGEVAPALATWWEEIQQCEEPELQRRIESLRAPRRTKRRAAPAAAHESLK
ncbi:MAG: polynucleotide adenylyltransferase PcnB [Gammaproteobacteria bacterium]